MLMTRQQWSAPAEPATVGRLRRAISAFAAGGGVSGAGLDDLRTCASEAVTNSIVHGFRDGRPPGTIDVSAEFRGEELVVVVSDDGMGFTPRTDSPGLGLGIPTIGALSGSMSIGVSPSGGTQLCMAFALTA